jgi:DNA anti-recombination protein RmuC
MTERDLLNLKEKIESSKESISQMKGQLTVLLQQLKESFDCSTFEQAKKKYKQMEKDHETLSSELEEEIENFEIKYLNEIDQD